MNKWQPIETAPKDGTRVLACKLGFNVCIAWWEKLPDDVLAHIKTREKWRNIDVEEFVSEDLWVDDWTSTWYEPTHWMPLPEPPLEEPK